MAAEHLAQLLEDTSIDCGPLGSELERRVLAGTATWSGMARQLGWVRYRDTSRLAPNGRRYQAGDGSRLRKAVGNLPYTRRYGRNKGKSMHQTRITFELAEFICRRLDIDMVDVGL